nr:putative reverse transcriptase domain-containing protein [Tanacetum cinerariifolium]GEX98803.1 putative reverse transcriptase domain-containing protein [Tanacetum cinerariifolium]
MSPVEYRTILKYRLMIPLFPVDAICPICRKACLDSFGEHAVHCKELSGFKYRHDMVRDVLFDICRKEHEGSILFGLPGSRQQKFLVLRFFYVKEQQGIDRLNIEKLDGDIVQKHGGSKQVGFKQLGPGVETGVHIVHDEKRVWFEVELQGAQGDREVEVFQEKEYQTGWKIKTGNVLDFCNQRSTQQCIKSESGLLKVFWVEDTTRTTYLVNRSPSPAIRFKKPIDMLGFFGWLASIKLDDVTSKVVLNKNMGFNESGEYKKTFIDFGVGTGSMQVLHGFEFEVKPLGDHTIEVEPQENIDQGAGLQEVQTQDLMDYQLAHDREQHLAFELFGYRENSNEAAFVVAAVEKIYAHESLTFTNTVSCELEGSLSKDYNVEKNGKWSCIYAVGSQEYQMVCTRPDIASIDVGMLDGFDRRLQTYVQVFVDFDYAMGRSITRYGFMIMGCAGSLKANLQHMEALSTTKAGYMTFTQAWKKKIWLKGLLTESRYELRLVAGIAIDALVKGYSLSEGVKSYSRHAGISAKKEVPLNLLIDPSNGRTTLRPADVLVFGWVGGKHACVNLTGVSPLVWLSSRDFKAGHAALKAASGKVTKHEKACIKNQHVFIPFAFDTFGFLAPEAVELLIRVQRVMHSNVMTPRSTDVVFKRMSFAIQKWLASQLVVRLPSIT